MLSIAFWNTNKKVSAELIAGLQRATDADIVILAECDLSAGVLLSELNRDPPHKSYFRELYVADFTGSRVRGFTRLYLESVAVSLEERHYFTWDLRLPNAVPLLLIAVHLRSKQFASDGDQAFFVRALLDDLQREEAKHRHENTIVIGDFNMSPFEDGVAAFDGFHAVMDRRIASDGARRISGRMASYFYNPMWSHMGDASRGPPGTYYYRGGKRVEYFWYMFDQVLLRPSLLPYFKDDHLQILTEVSGIPLLRAKGVIGDVSDHLPLSIRIEPKEIYDGKSLEDSGIAD